MYAIRKIRHFFAPAADRKEWVTDGFRGDVRAEFPTKAEADALASQLDGSPYETAHNESGRPTYKVVRI